MRLGNVFSSVITGNLVLLGVAAGRRSASLARSGGLALTGYAVGVMLGGLLAGRSRSDQPIWPLRVTIALAMEFAALAGFAVEWLIIGGRPANGGQLSLLALATVAMGVQSAAVHRLGQMSSTYLTATLVGLVTALAVRRRPADWQRSSAALLAMVLGATLGGLTATQTPAWLPVVILVPLATVITTAIICRRSA